MSLDKTIKDLNRQFGQGTIFKFPDSDFEAIKRVHSGSIGLDIALGGGIPIGRIIEMWGQESSGKTTAALHFIAEAQKLGIPCAFIDGEHSFDPNYASQIGVNIDELFFSQPVCLEDSLTIVQKLVEHGVFIVYDSTNSLPLRAEVDGNVGDHNVGQEGKLFSQACRMINPLLDKNGSTVIFLSQMRDKIGAMGYSEKYVVGRGKALKFYASIRLALARIRTNKSAGEAVSNRTKIVVKKNKTFVPYREAEIDISFGVGFDTIGELVDYGINFGLIQKVGAWLSLIDEHGEYLLKAQGKVNFSQGLTPEMIENLRGQILAQLDQD